MTDLREFSFTFPGLSLEEILLISKVFYSHEETKRVTTDATKLYG